MFKVGDRVSVHDEGDSNENWKVYRGGKVTFVFPDDRVRIAFNDGAANIHHVSEVVTTDSVFDEVVSSLS